MPQKRAYKSYTQVEAQGNRVTIDPWGVGSKPNSYNVNPFAFQGASRSTQSGIGFGAVLASLIAVGLLAAATVVPTWALAPFGLVAALGASEKQGVGPGLALALIGAGGVFLTTANTSYAILAAVVCAIGVFARGSSQGSQGSRSVQRSTVTYQPTGAYQSTAGANAAWQEAWNPWKRKSAPVAYAPSAYGPTAYPPYQAAPARASASYGASLGQSGRTQSRNSFIAALEPGARPRVG